MQLHVYPYEDNKNISVYCHLMKGKHDDHLRWPFKGTVTISLLDQMGDNQHHTRTIHLETSVNHADTVESLNLQKQSWIGIS